MKKFFTLVFFSFFVVANLYAESPFKLEGVIDGNIYTYNVKRVCNSDPYLYSEDFNWQDGLYDYISYNEDLTLRSENRFKLRDIPSNFIACSCRYLPEIKLQDGTPLLLVELRRDNNTRGVKLSLHSFDDGSFICHLIDDDEASYFSTNEGVIYVINGKKTMLVDVDKYDESDRCHTKTYFLSFGEVSETDNIIPVEYVASPMPVKAYDLQGRPVPMTQGGSRNVRILQMSDGTTRKTL